MAEKIRILIADDDVNICQLLTLYLTKEGFLVDIVSDGAEAVQKVKEVEYSILILDVMMPNVDGIEALKEIRTFSQVPVIMLTAKSEAIDKIHGLDSGADDYVTKPFEAQELISRIKAILRRLLPSDDETRDIVIDNLLISISNYIVQVNGVKLEMPPKEIELLHFLATHPKKVYTREQLLENIWGKNYTGDSRTVDVHVKRLREKLGENNSWKVTTVWGVGYKFEM